MQSFLAYFDIGIVTNVAVFVATMIFRQKILDWFNGVPPHLRSGLKSLETGVLDQVKTFEADLVGKMLPQVVKPAAPAGAPASASAFAPLAPAVLAEVAAPAAAPAA